MMNEAFLHYLWRFQKFTHRNFETPEGEPIEILFPGYWNQGSGPDFKEARLYIAGIQWSGSVELHLKSSDWYRHHHHHDTQYDNVILHVVWEHDITVCYPNGKPIPVLQIHPYVSPEDEKRYQISFGLQPKFIPCEQHISGFSKGRWIPFLERLFIERLEARVVQIQQLLKQHKNDWEAVFFEMLSKGFGLNVNGEAFLAMAKQLSIHHIIKRKHQPVQIEALFFGQLGILQPPFSDSYHEALSQEYLYLKQLHKLPPPSSLAVQFSRLRPANFPTLRIAQLASLYAKHGTLFQTMANAKTLSESIALFKVEPSEYWKTHYNFGIEGKPKTKKISRSFFDLIAINTLLPIRFAYSRYLGASAQDAILDWAAQIPLERNRILTAFGAFDLPLTHAGNSQAVLHLYKNYCQKRACLQCQVGNFLMKSPKHKN